MRGVGGFINPRSCLKKYIFYEGFRKDEQILHKFLIVLKIYFNVFNWIEPLYIQEKVPINSIIELKNLSKKI